LRACLAFEIWKRLVSLHTTPAENEELNRMRAFAGKIIKRLKTAPVSLGEVESRLDDIKINQGRILGAMNRAKTTTDLKEYEFKVFSQWGEDGIIQRLVDCVDIKNRTFIEFGVESFFESNCRYLMMNNNWAGFVIDGAPEKLDRLKQSHFYWKYQLEALPGFITRENINALLAKSGFEHDLGLLSVDIDGVDYFVLEAIADYRPRILVLEYNAVFGPTRKITVPYDAAFYRTSKHHSNLYFGASLGALTLLAARRGYSLVGTNTAGCNAFYVRNDLVNDKLQVLAAEAAYTASTAREGRDREGRLTMIGGKKRLEVIQGMPVLNVESGELESL